MDPYAVGFLSGLISGTIATLIVGFAWRKTVKQEEYDRGVRHGKELERQIRHKIIFQERFKLGSGRSDPNALKSKSLNKEIN